MGGCPGLLKYRRFDELWEAGNYGKIKRFVFTGVTGTRVGRAAPTAIKLGAGCPKPMDSDHGFHGLHRYFWEIIQYSIGLDLCSL